MRWGDTSVDTFRFLHFQVYKDSKVFFTDCIQLTQTFPRPFWELADQLRRAALSVCLNIAEGAAKYSDKDFKRHIDIALGSINESFACLDIACENKLISNTQLTKEKELSESVAKQLGGLSKKIRSSC